MRLEGKYSNRRHQPNAQYAFRNSLSEIGLGVGFAPGPACPRLRRTAAGTGPRRERRTSSPRGLGPAAFRPSGRGPSRLQQLPEAQRSQLTAELAPIDATLSSNPNDAVSRLARRRTGARRPCLRRSGRDETRQHQEPPLHARAKGRQDRRQRRGAAVAGIGWRLVPANGAINFAGVIFRTWTPGLLTLK
jgi:hypothetical protein